MVNQVRNQLINLINCMISLANSNFSSVFIYSQMNFNNLIKTVPTINDNMVSFYFYYSKEIFCISFSDWIFFRWWHKNCINSWKTWFDQIVKTPNLVCVDTFNWYLFQLFFILNLVLSCLELVKLPLKHKVFYQSLQALLLLVYQISTV